MAVPLRGEPRWPVALFDFDGTLGDSIGLITASFTHALDDVLGIEVEEDEIRSWIGRPLLEVLREAHPSHAEDIVLAYRAHNVQHHDRLIQSVPGISGLLRDLAESGVRTGVVSSKGKDLVEIGLRALGLDILITVLAGHDETLRHKPHPEPLLYAAKRLSSDPTHCVYIGDAVVDMEAGRAAGMATIGVTWGASMRQSLEETGPNAICDDTAELRHVLLPR